MHLPLDDTAFTYEERPVAIGQVVLAAVGWGEWARLRRALNVGRLAAERLEQRGEAVGEQELRPRLIAWRRERLLLAAEDYNAWLAARGLALDDMSGYLRRAAASERLGGLELDGNARDDDAAAADVAAEAVLSGQLRSWGERLGRQAAAARALGARGAEVTDAPGPDVAEALVNEARADPTTRLNELPPERVAAWAVEVLALGRAWERLAAEVEDEELIERCVRTHHLDWQRLAWEEATFAREDVALEAALWVRDEGTALSAIAERAGTPSSTGEAYGYDAGELMALLVGSRPGELVGPVATEAGWRLLHLRERVMPSAEDPQLRERAIGELLEDALAPHLAGRLEWHAVI
jgi:hypothetical protein